MNWATLKDIFREYGDVTFADVASYPDGRSKGFGTVTFSNREDAEKAISEIFFCLFKLFFFFFFHFSLVLLDFFFTLLFICDLFAEDFNGAKVNGRSVTVRFDRFS